jgi:hypothetical protein
MKLSLLPKRVLRTTTIFSVLSSIFFAYIVQVSVLTKETHDTESSSKECVKDEDDLISRSFFDSLC